MGREHSEQLRQALLAAGYELAWDLTGVGKTVTEGCTLRRGGRVSWREGGGGGVVDRQLVCVRICVLNHERSLQEGHGNRTRWYSGACQRKLARMRPSFLSP
ncbi:hypothetical protein Naga_101702g1 [Nannochloropsis gaditana]|uniref:Uncharacterized protein n=1 Tax=Nannochloropsis gaditana TaxID=72520 RepID=W7T9E0_9STRA|nr:hypothetical protein Naga_101702g1 [Nannochloropsis gaditana]